MRRILIVALLLAASQVAAQTYQAAVVTPWVGTGAPGNPYRPKLGVEYPLIAWDDITGQSRDQIIPSPNAYTLLVRCDGDTLDTIEDDGDYVVIWTEQLEEVAQRGILDTILSIFSPREAWADKPNRAKANRPKHQLPPAAERNKLRNDLKKLGYSNAQATALVREGVTRATIQDDIIAAQKLAPKAQ
ncbi:MAG TPA: hypothetical protein PKN27_04935 [Propionibacteriaceae bacterium]|nr:hypothetical protein [Propionibacteriaceae bacterium]